MRWVRVASALNDDVRVKAIESNRRRFECLGVLTVVAGWCSEQLTDGYIPYSVPLLHGASATAIAELVRVGLWVEDPGYGWVFAPGVIGP